MFPKESRGPYLGSGVASSWEHETAAVQYTADRCLVRSMSRPMSCGSCRFFLRTFLTSVFLLGQHSRQERQLPPISFFFVFEKGQLKHRNTELSGGWVTTEGHHHFHHHDLNHPDNNHQDGLSAEDARVGLPPTAARCCCLRLNWTAWSRRFRRILQKICPGSACYK